MSVEEIKKRFVNEIKLRAYDDKYIDKNEEREILQIAIQLGVSIDSARMALVQVCEDHNYVMESVLLKMIKEQVEAAFGNDGKIDQKEFDLIFGNIRRAAQNKKNDREIKKMIVTVMEDSGLNKVKTGWFSNWYTALKQDLGM
jgi:ABC-type Fe3+-hydroxamate transport system substrate-binding protein